jgi:hypothetical protein
VHVLLLVLPPSPPRRRQFFFVHHGESCRAESLPQKDQAQQQKDLAQSRQLQLEQQAQQW